jgi:hypothetical protein
MKDRPFNKERRTKEQPEISQHSTRYDKYKADLHRLFDQGQAGELLKKTGKEASPGQEKETPELPKTKTKTKKSAAAAPRANGRIPRDSGAATNRLRLMRSVIAAEDRVTLIESINALVERFGLPDDWEILIRVLEHQDESLVQSAVAKMRDLVERSAKIPRRYTLKERLRSIGQTAAGAELRSLASELESAI